MSYIGQYNLDPNEGWMKLTDIISFTPATGDYYNFSLEGNGFIRWCQQDEEPTNKEDGILIQVKNFGYNVKDETNVWVKSIYYDTLISID